MQASYGYTLGYLGFNRGGCTWAASASQKSSREKWYIRNRGVRCVRDRREPRILSRGLFNFKPPDHEPLRKSNEHSAKNAIWVCTLSGETDWALRIGLSSLQHLNFDFRALPDIHRKTCKSSIEGMFHTTSVAVLNGIDSYLSFQIFERLRSGSFRRAQLMDPRFPLKNSNRASLGSHIFVVEKYHS